MRLRLGNKHHLRNLQIEKHKISSVSGTNAFLICAFRSADFLRWCLFPKRNLTHNLFFYFQYFLVLIWFIFSIFSTRKKNGAAGNSIVCFAASIPCQSRHLTVRRIQTVSKSATFLAMESVNSAHFKRWKTEVQNFGKEKRKTLRQYWGAHFWQGEVQNSSPILARQWWRHFRLSLSLCIIGSAEALPILCVRYFRWERERERYREREREKDGSDVTIVALKLAMNTLSLAKNSHNWRWAYTFPCQKFALFVSPFTLPVSPFTERSPLWRWISQWVHTFHCQKFLRPLCSPSFKWHEPHDEWSKTQDKWSNPAQSYFVLPIEKLNQINTKNYWK